MFKVEKELLSVNRVVLQCCKNGMEQDRQSQNEAKAGEESSGF